MSDIRSVIRGDAYRSYTDLLCFDKGVKLDRLSDFELFAFLCDNISSIYGSPLRRDLEGIVSQYADATALCDRETQKRLWRALNGDTNVRFDIAKMCTQNNSCRLSSAHDKRDLISLRAMLESDQALPEELDRLIDRISNDGKDLLADLGGLRFERPDEYHSSLAYRRVLGGEQCSREDGFKLIAWIICRTLMRRNAILYIYPDKDLSAAAALLELMSERKLYPRIFITADSKEDVLNVCSLCISSSQKNISLEIYVPKETDEKILSDIISAAAEILPMTRIFVSTEVRGEESERLLENTARIIS